MANNFRQQVKRLYDEMHKSQMELFSRGSVLCNEGNYDEGLSLLHQGNALNNIESYLLIIWLDCQREYPLRLPEKAESLH